MVNYQNGKVYKIINEKNEIVYIGSTTQSLSQRYTIHKHKSPNHKIILIENYSCNSKEELCMREQQIIEEHSNLLNLRNAYISEEEQKKHKKEYQKEYYEKNKEYQNQKNKEWQENNKEHKKEYDKKRYEKNKDKIKEYQKECYENNKEEKKEWQKEYYEKNKDKINEKVKCEFCNCEISKQCLKRHQKRKKCLKFQNL